MKRKRKALNLAVKIPAKIVDHLLPNFDRRIIIEDAHSCEEKINDDQTCARNPEDAL
jgi:hypothetical protein